MSPRPGRQGGPGWLARLVAALPATSALVLSFDGLSELARASRVAERLAYLWPIALDATGVVASLIWLDRRMPADARRAARWLALATILVSISGNGLWHWLVETNTRPHVAVQIAVGAVPPGVLFGLLHVWQLATRRPATTPARQPAPPRPASQPPSIVVHGIRVIHTPGALLDVRELPSVSPLALIGQPHPPTSQPHPTRHQPASPAGQPGGWRAHLPAARAALAQTPGIGRPALAHALGVPSSVARRLLEHLRAESAATAAALPIGATP